MSRVLPLVFFAVLSCQVKASETEKTELNRLFDAIWAYEMNHDPIWATHVGYPGLNGLWPDVSLDAVARDDARRREFLTRIRAIDASQLDEDARLDWRLVERKLADQVAGAAFPEEYLLIHQRAGVQQHIPDTLAIMPRRNRADFTDRLQRLEQAAHHIRQTIEVLRQGLRMGVTPPRITLRHLPEQIRNVIPDRVQDSPLLADFSRFPATMAKPEQAALIDQARVVIAGKVYPAFEALLDFVENEYIPNASQSIALSDLPDGEAWYRHRVRHFTTSPLSAEAIHQLGLREVKRIRAEMDKVIADSGFDGDFQAFTRFLRTDPQFYMTSAESLLSGYRDIAKRVDPELAKLFGTLPRLPYGVKAVPDYAARSQTTAYYMSGSARDGRAGYFFANTYALETRPTWEMEALTLHEAMPGHHLQIALAQELPATHPLRRHLHYTSFVEGWGLYAESLGEEMGLYADPYSKFGQLTYEMWRAVRLVVDTGMHLFGWDRQKAIDFFADNTAKTPHDIEVEIDRYISWPGQALAYKLGELQFKALRAHASATLGAAFDIRDFHDQLLLKGALPLDILEQRIHRWVAQQQ